MVNGKRTKIAAPSTTSQHHKRRKQRGAKNPSLHFGHIER